MKYQKDYLLNYLLQKDAVITQDRKYVGKTHAALMNVLANDEASPAEDTPAPAPERKVVLVSASGKVNIRTGNGTNYARITSAKAGTAFTHVATAENGWHAVVVGSRVGWVSGEFSRIE